MRVSTLDNSLDSVPRGPQRNEVLDNLRAAAVLSVVAYHVVQMSPVPLPSVVRVTHYGQYGVDLFFALSGWLIGGLYWREMRKFGNVQAQRFWGRRWMRTLPPYFVALGISWAAVWWARGEPFDRGYLVFFQNYYERIPFFLVSWSLCIEEHFYLAAPVVAGILIGFLPRERLGIAWALLIAASPVFRWVEGSAATSEDFGYSQTATHLRLDGLVMGFGLSYAGVFAQSFFGRIERRVTLLVAACLIALVGLELIGGVIRYALWPAVVAALCSALVVFAVRRRSYSNPGLGGPGFRPWAAVALVSYSAYLVHPLAIHIARNAVAAVAGPQLWLLYWPIVVFAIGTMTVAFYFCVERPSILLRDAYLRPRAASASGGRPMSPLDLSGPGQRRSSSPSPSPE